MPYVYLKKENMTLQQKLKQFVIKACVDDHVRVRRKTSVVVFIESEIKPDDE